MEMKYEPATIDVKYVHEPGWNLSVIEGLPIQRVIWIHFQVGHVRTGHALKTGNQMIIVQAGQVEVLTECEHKVKKFVLRAGGRALLLPAMTWRSYIARTKDAMMTVLCSNIYNELDYIRDYQEYVDAVCESGEEIQEEEGPIH